MSGRIFYTLGIAFTSGIFFRSFFDISLAGTVLTLFVAFGCGVVWRIKARGFDSPLFLFSIALIAMFFGMVRYEIADSYVSVLSEHEGERVVLHGIVQREPEVRDREVILSVRPSLDNVSELVLVSIDKFAFPEDEVAYGDTVEVRGVVKRPTPFETDGGRTFDYPGYLRARNIYYTIPFADVRIIEKSSTVITKLFSGKHTFMNVIEEHVPTPESGLGEGVLLGVKRSLGDALEMTFRKTGIIHIVVLSGYNIMIIVEALMYLLTFFFFPRVRMVLGMSGVVAFAILVGFSATVLRASLMAILLIIARTTGRVYAVLRALMLTLITMLLCNPFLLVHDVGFQLSFLATLGLILFSPPIEERLMSFQLWGWVRSLVVATLATQIVVLPILLYQTGMFSVVALIVNVLVLPMVPYAMGLTFLVGFVGTFSATLGSLVGYLAYLSLAYIITVAKLFGSLPFSVFIIGQFSFSVVVILYIGILLFYLVLTRVVTLRSENPYEDWVIEEDKERSTEELQSNTSTDPFPFR